LLFLNVVVVGGVRPRCMKRMFLVTFDSSVFLFFEESGVVVVVLFAVV
jgi:hypothetical protein